MKLPAALLAVALSTPAAYAATPDTPSATKWTMAPALSAVNEKGVRGSARSRVALSYDSFTGRTATTTTGSPRTYMGTPFTVSPNGSTVSVTAARIYLASTAAQSYSNGLTIRMQFWDAFDGNGTQIFSTTSGAIQTFTVAGPVNLTASTFTPIDVTFATPIALNSNVNNGVVINYQGDNGTGPASVDTLTSLICTVAEPGSHTLPGGQLVDNGAWASPDYGFYRNVSNQTDFNHASSDRRTFASVDDIVLCLQLTGDVTPVELQSFDVE